MGDKPSNKSNSLLIEVGVENNTSLSVSPNCSEVNKPSTSGINQSEVNSESSSSGSKVEPPRKRITKKQIYQDKKQKRHNERMEIEKQKLELEKQKINLLQILLQNDQTSQQEPGQK